MKILIFTSDIEIGGIANVTKSYHQIFTSLFGDDNVDLAVIEASEDIVENNSTYIFNKKKFFERVSFQRKILRIFRSFFLIKSLLKKNHYDIVLSLNLEPNFIILVHQYFFPKKTKIITTDHTDLCSFYKEGNVFKKGFRHLSAPLYSKADLSIGCSHSVTQSIFYCYGVSKCRTRTVFNPLRPDLNSNFSTDNTSYYCSVGRLDPSKGYDFLILAMKDHLKASGFKLAIVGEGPERPRLESIIKKEDLTSYVILHGFQENPAKVIAGASAYISSSKQEGFGLTLIEAMFLKVPVISTDCNSGPREIIEPNSDINKRIREG